MKNTDNIHMLAYMPAYFYHYYFLRSTWYVMFWHTKFHIAINISHITFSSVSELSHTRLA